MKNIINEILLLKRKAVRENNHKDELFRVLLMINKKRGYKSNRKGQEDEDGTLIDGMALARKLRDEGMTPGQYLATLDEHKIKAGVDFYKSDLEIGRASCRERDQMAGAAGSRNRS